MKLARRLRHQLSFANVLACLALFVALGGGAYAASQQVNGKYIVKRSIGGNKLKNETITSKQIKKGTLNSSVIDVSTLTTVPSAQTAVTATSATTANSANSANTANTANTATKASSADTATKAGSAETAERATDADHATSADSAGEANHATSADDADTLDGESAAQLTVSCRDETEPFGGICWDEAEQQARGWIAAIDECSARGGRLPTIGELIAFVLRPQTQASEENWTGQVVDLDVGNKEFVITSDENSRHKIDVNTAGSLPYRCVFYRAN
jgi:hypothetical protein